MTKVENVIVNEEDSGIRLDRWFKRHHPKVSHISVEKALRKGQIRVDGKKVKAGHRMEAGQEVRVPPLVEYTPKEKTVKLIPAKYIDIIQKSVLYKDSEIIIINKPSGLAVQGGVGVDVSVDLLLDYLKFDYTERPKLVHRLDKDTSGILILARKTSIASKVTEAFRDKSIEKVYWAVVIGAPKEREGKITLPLLKRDTGAGKEKVVVDEENGLKATTLYRILDNAGGKVSLLELRPLTGRTHQLRVHMAAIGHPILGDGKYGGRGAFIEGLENKMHLHARQINLPPKMAKKLEFIAPIKGHMELTFKELELDADK